MFLCLLISPLKLILLYSPYAGPNYSFLQEAKQAPPNLYYDYIIIGGGTSGCALAATLSQNATVLVLERGGSPYGNPKIRNLDSFFANILDNSPLSPSQSFISEDGVFNNRARVLGGGSALNAGFYSRASAGYVKSSGWDERLVKESYEWVEKKVVFKPPMLQWQSAVRDGLLEAGVLPYNGFSYEHLYGTKVGGPYSIIRITDTLLLICSSMPTLKILLFSYMQQWRRLSLDCLMVRFNNVLIQYIFLDHKPLELTTKNISLGFA